MSVKNVLLTVKGVFWNFDDLTLRKIIWCSTQHFNLKIGVLMANAIVFQISWGFFAKIIFWSRIQGKQILECFHSNCCQGGKPSTHLKELFEFYDLVKLHCFLMISTWVILSQTYFIVPVATVTVPKLVSISYIWSYIQAAKTLRFVGKQILKVICCRLTENVTFPAKLLF